MTQQQARAQQDTPYADSPSGWTGVAAFGGIMMILMGAFTAFTGLVAIFDDGWYAKGTQIALWNPDLTAWGWFWLVVGIAVGVGLALINALGQLVFLPYYPWWSAIMITLDVLIIYTLVAHGRELAN